MSMFKYDIVTLIELVEPKTCLWDKSDEGNKNKILRQRSWKEIFEYLEDGYETLNAEEKKKVGDAIMKKWENIRDAFLRSQKTKRGKAAKKSYMYAKHTQFLLNSAQKDDTISKFTQDLLLEDVSDDMTDAQIQSPYPSQTELNVKSVLPTDSQVICANVSDNQQKKVTKPPGKKCKRREPDFLEQEILSEIKRPKPVHVPTEHVLMLLSFKPYIRDFNESELLDLHMEFLKIIKSIKDKRSRPSSSALSTFNYPSTHDSSSSGTSCFKPNDEMVNFVWPSLGLT